MAVCEASEAVCGSDPIQIPILYPDVELLSLEPEIPINICLFFYWQGI